MPVTSAAFQIISQAIIEMSLARGLIVSMQQSNLLPTFDLSAALVRIDRVLADLNTALKTAL